jgi:hypothetical protein
VQQSGDNRTPGPPLAHYASVAHVARVYDYLLGGKDNFAPDREAAEQAMLINPAVVPTARANRAFLARATRYLTGEAVLRQFLDIGTGMPAGSNIHEVAQSVAPQARVVYVDHSHDAEAATRARLRLNRSRSPGGRTSASWSSEAETSRWNALAASRPSGVSAMETARRSPGTAVRATSPRRSARSASPVRAAFSMPSRPASCGSTGRPS